MKGLEEMKQTMKRLAASALAAVMTLGLSATAFAAGNDADKTLTVTGDTLGNKKVYAVQMFEARVTEGETNSFDSYVLVNAEKWMEFFKATSQSGGVDLTDQDFDGDVDADDARAYLEKLDDESAAVKTFADKAQKWVRDHSSYFTVITSDDESEPVADKETFTNLKPGYYLVYPEGGSTGDSDRGTDAMLVNVPTDGNAEWNMKSTFPTVDKKVDTDNEGNGEAADNGSAQIGDIVTFTLTSKVPDMSDYREFYFAFKDTLSKGLEFVTVSDAFAETDVTVHIFNAESGETADENHKVDVSYFEATLSGSNLNIVFSNLKTVMSNSELVATGDTIQVTYKAMITEEATTENPATNTVEVEYSNDPSSDSHGTSTPDETDVYTYDIKVNKWATDAGGKDGNLAGAKFVLSTNATAPTAEQIAGNYSDYTGLIWLVGSDNSYRVAKPDEIGEGKSAVPSFTTTATGDITISGLEGSTTGTTYYLHEIEAPAGYNQLKAPITIVITMTNTETGEATITVDGQQATGSDGTVVDVENKKGITLPETGSIGTIGLTVAGVAIVLLGVFATRKKKTTQE